MVFVGMMDINFIKKLGAYSSPENFATLMALYHDDIDLELKREVVSSIGRQDDKQTVAQFIKDNFASPANSMDMVYQFYRTCLINYQDPIFNELAHEIEDYYQNEYIAKMKRFYLFKTQHKFSPTISNITNPTLLIGDCCEPLKKIDDNNVHLIFTSPPYYNARDYVVYKSYQDYLDKMLQAMQACHRVLEDGRYIVINVSPVIVKRAGRDFESTRYPIAYDFHQILTQAGFEYIDDIVWIKPDYSVPNRNAGYIGTQMPLSYKPNNITESIKIGRAHV